MADPDLRLNELSKHDAEDIPTAIRVLEIDEPIDLKVGILHLLPKFYGKRGEDPFNYLSEFTKIYKIPQRPPRSTEDQLRLAAFPFALSQ